VLLCLQFVPLQVDLCGLSDADAARQIHSDAVNVLVDLDGFTRSSRAPALLGLRPAPLQVVYGAGCPITRGLPNAVQYVITDRVTLPKVTTCVHSVRDETQVKMPHCIVNDRNRPLGEGDIFLTCA